MPKIDELEDLPEELRSYIGASTGAARRSADPINASTIRHWLRAMGFADPATGLVNLPGQESGVITAPVTMLQAWTHHDRRFPETDANASPVTVFERVLEADGFTGVLGTASAQQYNRKLLIGGTVTMTGTIKSISQLKRTRLGDGRFITFRYEYHSDAGELVGSIEMTSLRYRPLETDEPSQPPSTKGTNDPTTASVETEVERTSAMWFPTAARPLVLGVNMPTAKVPVTATLVVAGALATQDFHPVHHDFAYARSVGNVNIIMSIMTSLGLAERVLYGWLGDDWQINCAAMKLGSPCYPGDNLLFSGSVGSVLDQSSGFTVNMEGRTGRGVHLSVTANMTDSGQELIQGK